MPSLVAAKARLESIRAEAAPTNVPAAPLVNVEPEFRQMQRVIDELQAEFARHKSKEIRVQRGRQVSVSHRFAAIQEESGDWSRNAAQSFGHWWTGRRIRVDVHSYRDSNQRLEIWFQGNESGGRGRRTQVPHTDRFPIGTGGKG